MGILRAALPGIAGALAAACLGLLTTPSLADSVCTLVSDVATGNVLLQEGVCDRPVPPASTFKIAISLMGFDAGFLQDPASPKLPFKEGYPDWREEWRTDIDPQAWMRESVVWYSQQVTQALGKERFAAYVREFDYGNEDVSGDPGKDNGLMRSWLSSSLRISPVQQVEFARRVVRRELPVSTRAYDMTEAILEKHELASGWTVQGKTGAGFSVAADGEVDRRRPFGWYVGWATRGDRTLVFARLKEFSKRQKMSPGMGARDDVLELLSSSPEALRGVTD
jgi:beta-lactamase class D